MPDKAADFRATHELACRVGRSGREGDFKALLAAYPETPGRIAGITSRKQSDGQASTVRRSAKKGSTKNSQTPRLLPSHAVSNPEVGK